MNDNQLSDNALSKLLKNNECYIDDGSFTEDILRRLPAKTPTYHQYTLYIVSVSIVLVAFCIACTQLPVLGWYHDASVWIETHSGPIPLIPSIILGALANLIAIYLGLKKIIE